MAPKHKSTIILGAGMSGILSAISLLRLGHAPSSLLILERNSSFGGVWASNTYPGCACDVPSHVYQVRWHPNTQWTEKYAQQAEIQAYYQRLALEWGLEKVTEFGTEVVQAKWRAEGAVWVVETEKDGEKVVWEADCVVSAIGFFSKPHIPSLPGIASFSGDQWHTGSWPASYDLSSKRVCIIGTGPSAAQVIPSIAPVVGHMTVFQRSPAHIFPRGNFAFPAWVRWVFGAIPFAAWVYALISWKVLETTTYLATTRAWASRLIYKVYTKHLDDSLGHNEELRGRLMSEEAFGCKRPVVLDDYLTTFDRENVSLVTDGVTRITQHGVVSTDSEGKDTETKCDVIVWGTGYNMKHWGHNFPILGLDGINLGSHYGSRWWTYHGVATHNFPNFCTVLGPHSIALWSNICDVVDVQTRYNAQVIDLVVSQNRKGAAAGRTVVVIKEKAAKAWVESIATAQAELPAVKQGCIGGRSAYAKDGHTFLYPFRPSTFNKGLQKADWDAMYDITRWYPEKEEEEVSSDGE